MSRSLPLLVVVCLTWAVGCRFAISQETATDVKVGIAERVTWHNSHLVGSPDPPLPYTTEPVFDAIEWKRPIYAKAEPGTQNLLVVSQGGEEDTPTRIVRVDETSPSESVDFLTIERRLVYGLAFDPEYQSNGFVYLFSNGPTGEAERKNRVSRFTVSRSPSAQCDPASELTIIEWRSMGHDGGELGFGNDGMLYITSGDGTSDSDIWLSAQDVSNLLGGVLRIDVRGASEASPYKIPTDNPFLDVPGARGEWWAFGLRNPWRLWCDPLSGQIWVGNNGQDLWETIHLIRRGENYGWSVYEGSHPFYPQRQRGPAAIVPPTIEHHHTEARSLTGGVVYRGSQFPELDGVYLYGDYSTGKIWGVRHDGKSVIWHEELADTVHQIAGFAITPSGSLLIVDHGGGLYRMKKSEPSTSTQDFPDQLSETGLFTSVSDHVLQPGILSYSVNAQGWNDHATAQRYLAVPGSEQIDAGGNRGWEFPNGSVVVQTLSMPMQGTSRRIETRVLLREQNEWAGYSYKWNADQTDAQLVAKTGEDIEIDSLGGQSIQWHIPSRSECMSCHSRAVNFVLGLSTAQLDRQHDYGDVNANQLATFNHIGLIKKEPGKAGTKLVDPYDVSLPLDERARSYLHVNCSCCHVEAGGGNARMQLEASQSLEKMELISARPQHATFNLGNAMLVAPGEPDRSVLVARISRRGSGQMPPLFTRAVDETGVELLTNWIRSLPRNERPFVRAWKTDELVSKVDGLDGKQRSLETGKALYRELGCIQCHRLADEGGGAGPDLTELAVRSKPSQIIQSVIEPSALIAPEFASTMVVTVDGRVLIGRVEYESDELIRLRSAESFDAPITIRQEDIDQRAPSRVSMMPADMLNSCTEDEILDLVYYLTSPHNKDGSDASQ